MLREADERVIRLIRRLLKGGVLEDGLVTASEEGVPQGGPLSPILSNIYLHYVLDLWFERRFQKTCRGEAYLIRYVDDFVVCFKYRADADRFLAELPTRLGKFHLAVEPTKTRRLCFGRYAGSDGRKPDTFDFLGFTHRGETTRTGSFKVKRETSKKKFRAALATLTDWLRRERSRHKTGESR